MVCQICQSKNVQLLKDGEFFTGSFCNDCGNGGIDLYQGSCCGNQSLIDIRFEQANGTWVQRVACKNCKTLIGGAKKKGEGFEKMRPYFQKAYVEYEKSRLESRSRLHSYIIELSKKFRENKSKEWWDDYAKYLKTDKWKGKRLQVLEREHSICQGCGYSKAVHVHHTTYDNLGDELLFQLVALCVHCHSKVHPDKFLS